jgi:hypothetical protein
MPERQRRVCLSSISQRTLHRYSEARAVLKVRVQWSVLCRGLPGLWWDLPRSSDTTVEGGLSKGRSLMGTRAVSTCTDNGQSRAQCAVRSDCSTYVSVAVEAQWRWCGVNVRWITMALQPGFIYISDVAIHRIKLLCIHQSSPIRYCGLCTQWLRVRVHSSCGLLHSNCGLLHSRLRTSAQ